MESVYQTTKMLDPTRPCVDVSGGYHGKYTDLFDFHCYHSAEEIEDYIEEIEKNGKLVMDTLYGKSAEREGTVWDGKKPIHASEYGGVAYIKYSAADDLKSSVSCGREQNAWGYSTSVSEDEFVEQYIKTTEQYLACDKICGFCYTQLYDVEQEQNGLYTYGRIAKFSQSALDRIKECNNSSAAIEKDN